MAFKEKIIVTGGAGYIGSHTVVELYNAGFEPIIIDDFSNSEPSVLEGLNTITKTSVKVYKGDCNDRAFIKNVFQREGEIKGIIHFAAFKAVGESVQEPLNYYENNIYSLIVLLREMLENNIPYIVFSSSCTVYGQPDKLPVTELTPKKPAESPYGNTKQVCEEMLEDLVKSLQLKHSNKAFKAIALRYFNPIGAHATSLIGELPRGVPGNLVPFITQTAVGLREKLTIFGNDYNTPDGTCVRDYIHVVDLAVAHVKAIEYLKKAEAAHFYDIFNVGTGRGNTVLEVVQTFEKVTGEKLNYTIGKRRDGDVEQVYASVDKIERLLGWKAEKNLDQSLIDAWNWQKSLKK